jgi:pilus assembly protein Flp/PilA
MLTAFLKKFVADQTGATAVEYGLIVTLIVIAMIVGLQGVANATIDMWGVVESEITEATEN